MNRIFIALLIVFLFCSTTQAAVTWDEIKLLVHWNGADGFTTYTTDDAGARIVTFGGTAQGDTAQKYFGTASLLLDGNSDYNTVPDSNDWYFDGDFTIDMWVRFNSTTGNQVFIGQVVDNGVTGYWYIRRSLGGGGTIQVFLADSGIVRLNYSVPFTPSTNTWYHIAVTRSGNTWNTFIDGVAGNKSLDGGAYTASFTNFNLALGIGYDQYGDGGIPGLYVNGWLDELRIVKGEAQWTANFDVRTVEYSESNPTGDPVLESGQIF